MRIVAFAILLGVLVSPAFAVEKQFCLKDSLGLVGVKPGDCFKEGETVALLDRQVADAEGKPMTIALAMGGETRSVDTCTAYLNAFGDGFDVADEAQRPNQRRFAFVCGAAALLIGARPAKQSFLGEWGAELRDLNRVSIDILPVVGDGEPSIGSEASVKSLGADVQMLDHKVADLELKYNGAYAAYREVARGDFNADEIEDVLVLVHTESPDGKQKMDYSLPLSRFDANSLLMRADAGAE